VRVVTIALATLVVGLGVGLGLGSTVFEETITETVVMTTAAPPPASKGDPTLRIQFQDLYATTACETDEYLPDPSSIEVRAPGNGLTSGELLGLPDESTAMYLPLGDAGVCELSIDVPDLAPSRFYVIRMSILRDRPRDVSSQFSGAELKRNDWTALINMRTSPD
jgi:hypothetical protein